MAPVMSVPARQIEIDIIIAVSAYLVIENKDDRRYRRWRVHPLHQKRVEQGAYHTLIRELSLDDVMFQRYFRLTREQFAQLLFILNNDLTKFHVSLEVLCPRQRLAICLRYLATGESYTSLSFSYRVGVATISNSVPEVCEPIWKHKDMAMKIPSDKDDWKLIAANFQDKWQFPHCLGAIDGKHVVMMKPWKSGSLYYNYKGTCSIVLMALVDANLRFIAIDTGSFGRNSDGGIFARSNLGKRFATGNFNFPPSETLSGFEHLGPLPYVAVGDEAFPLLHHLMRPFPGRENVIDKQIFNYRLSRARRIVENAFGILAARWRVFHTKIALHPENTNSVIKASCVLHNMLQISSTPAQVTQLMEEMPDMNVNEGLIDLPRTGNRAGQDAICVRNSFKTLFMSDNSVPWQRDHVRRGYFAEQ